MEILLRWSYKLKKQEETLDKAHTELSLLLSRILGLFLITELLDLFLRSIIDLILLLALADVSAALCINQFF